MTNAQKWMAAFLGLFLILLVLGRITKKDDSASAMPEQYMNEASDASASVEADGFSLIKNSGCITCHGSNLQGTKMAPALQNLKEYWTKEKLIGYLRNPSSYSSDSRFASYKEKYKNIMMPSYGNKDIKDLGKMAEYLLTK